MPDSPPPPRIARLASTRRGSRTATSPSVPGVSRRLAALERQVEEALTSARSMSRLPPLEDLLDGVLETADRLRRAAAGGPGGAAAPLEAPLALLYRWWWRVDVVGLERLPRRGPVLVMANRGGTLLPYEAFMLARALGSAAPESRPARPLLDDWLLRVPLVGGAATALGAVAAS